MQSKKIKEILIGSNNNGKIKEIKDLLPKKLKIYTPKEYKIKSPKETGNTFKKNSYLKAKYFSKKTGKICLADDSGLEIYILDKLPGIYSARWAGKKKNFNMAIKKVYKQLKKKKLKNNNKVKARFVCALTIYWPNGKFISSIGKINGNISKNKIGKKGFGYDPIFIPEGYSKTFAELDMSVKNAISHRGLAVQKLVDFLNKQA